MLEWRRTPVALLFVPILALGLASCQDRSMPVEPDVVPRFHGEDDDGHSHGRFFHISWVPRPDIDQFAVEFRYAAAFRRGGYFTCWTLSNGSWSSHGCSGGDGNPLPGDIVLETIGATNFVFGDGTATGTLRFLVTSIDVAGDWLFAQAVDPDLGTPGLLKTYSGSGPFTASSFTCCRIFGLNNFGEFYGVAAVVTPGTGNRSPVSTIVPIVNVVRNGVQTWSIPASDPDGDGLGFSLTNPASWPIDGVQPLDMSIDATSGLVSWDTDGKPLGLYWSNVTIEELNPDASTKGFVMVDYLINLVETVPDNDPPFFTAPPFCSASVNAEVGELLSFSISASDPDAGDVVTLSAAGVPPGATFDPGTPGNPVNGSLSWTPTAAAEGTHIVSISATDQHGAQALCPVTIIVGSTEPEPPQPPPPGEEGCSPGFWKNHSAPWQDTGYDETQTVGSVFADADPFDGVTLSGALDLRGGPGVNGAKQILLRAAVAALLNAAHPDVAYPRSVGEVIADVNDALGSNHRGTILALASDLDHDNNLLCPF